VHKPSAFAVEKAIKKIKRHKSPVTDQIPTEFIKAGIGTTQYEIHKFINSV
jgi:hypothetical protein